MNASRDQNLVTVLQGALSTDGQTPTSVLADPSAHYVFVDDDTTGSDLTGPIAPRDGNLVPVGMATSSADGVTPVVLYVNSSGELLVDSS